MGLLYQFGAVTDPRTYYCPSQSLLSNNAFAYRDDLVKSTQNTSVNGTASPGAWLLLSDSDSRTGYMFQVHAIKANGNWQEAYPHTGDYPPQEVVAVDIIWGPEYVPHGNPSIHSSVTFNSLFIDGHVEGVNGGIKRPIQKNPDGTIHSPAGAVMDDMKDAPNTFDASNEAFLNTVWDLDYAAQHH